MQTPELGSADGQKFRSACTSLQSVEQLAFADVILLNKTDLIEDEDKARILRRIKVGAHCSSRC